jgi:hypothetical protein
MEVIDKILREWSFRCHDGIVDMNDPKKIDILNEILGEYGVDEAGRGRPSKPLPPEDTSEIGQIISTLKGAGLRKDALEQIKNKLLSYNEGQLADFKNNFRSYNINQTDEIFKYFGRDFYDVTFKGLGRGEVMLILGLKDSKSGGTSTKDIEIKGEDGNKTYEVKELAGGEFSLGSDGYIVNTAYLQNLTSLKKYLTKEVANILDITDDERNTVNRTIDYYTENGPNNASRGFLNDLEKTCQILNKNISKTDIQKINYISVGGRKIAVSDEDLEKIKAGSGPVTISFGDEVDETKINLSKLDTHPWVKDPSLVKNNLYTIWNSFLDKIDGLIFFKYPNKPGGILMNKKEVNSNFIPFRIVQNSLLAKEKSGIKKEIVEDEDL